MADVPATYAIHVYNDKNSQIGSQVFQGANAYNEASEHLERVKQLPRAFEIWFTRMDGPQPVFVCKPLVRDGDGTWHEESKD